MRLDFYVNKTRVLNRREICAHNHNSFLLLHTCVLLYWARETANALTNLWQRVEWDFWSWDIWTAARVKSPDLCQNMLSKSIRWEHGLEEVVVCKLGVMIHSMTTCHRQPYSGQECVYTQLEPLLLQFHCLLFRGFWVN